MSMEYKPTKLAVFTGSHSNIARFALVDARKACVHAGLNRAPEECAATRAHLASVVAVLARLLSAHRAQRVTVFGSEKRIGYNLI